MTRKIAPNLMAYPRREGRGKPGEHARAALESFSMAGLASCHPATVQRGLRELRALLAVARAAEEQAKHNWKHRSPGSTLDRDGSCLCYLCRDLARLHRVSGGKGTRHG